VPNLDVGLERLEQAGREWPYTVLWSDLLPQGAALGRGILQMGRWAEPHEAPRELPRWRGALAVPTFAPSWLLQPWMVALGYFGRYALHGERPRIGPVHPETFFYPLDIIGNWNRMYGKRGFTQYQAVLPGPHGHARHRRFVDTLRQRGADVFLCVIKDCGAEGRGMLSFPKPGVSYALDIPMGPNTQAVVDALNDVVCAEGGRIYLAKDALTRPHHFRAMEPRLDAWNAVRRAWDPQGRVKSAQSIRLLGDRP
jgi:FAD/FMN-containing dehydrogenase